MSDVQIIIGALLARRPPRHLGKLTLCSSSNSTDRSLWRFTRESSASYFEFTNCDMNERGKQSQQEQNEEQPASAKCTDETSLLPLTTPNNLRRRVPQTANRTVQTWQRRCEREAQRRVPRVSFA